MTPRDFHPFQLADVVIRNLLRRIPPSSWTEWIAAAWGFRYRPAPTVVKLRCGPSIFIDPSDYPQILLYYLRTFEPHCLRLLPRFLRAGSTMVDVGANIGVYTLACAKIVGPRGRVIAVEAAPPLVDQLRQNVKRNGFGHVSVVSTAIRSETADGTLVLPVGGNWGMFTLGEVEGAECYRVATRRLDDVLRDEQAERIDLVKMDIEGSEYHALLGACELLERARPSFIIELNELALRRCRASPAGIKQIMYDAGYRGWIVGRSKFRPLKDCTFHHVDECLFVHEDRHDHITSLGL